MNTKIALFSAAFLFSTHSFAANLDLSNTPLYLGGNVAPNIMFILDDSGSMMLEVTPDDLALNGTGTYGGFVFPRADNVYGSDDYADNFIQTTDPRSNQAYAAMTRSSQFNVTYYNPAITYTPWVRASGSPYPNATPSCALHNPERTGNCPSGHVNTYARNLTTTNGRYNNNYWRRCSSDGNCDSSTSTSSTYDFWPATYYYHTGGNRWNINNYNRVEIRSNNNSYSGHGRINREECNNGTCTYAQEIQNFANWYTYYRSRILAARAGIGKAFAAQGTTNRIGYGAINKSSSSVDGQNTSTIVRGVREFSGTARENFFNELYTRSIPALGTPLRQALDDAGQYFSRSDSRGPWSDTPGQSGGGEQICRQNYSILMTDGYWSGGSSYQADTSSARQNVDGSTGPTHNRANNGGSYQYSPIGPYRDNASNTLADVAMYYWSRDLRTDMENDVPTSSFNEAFWQHMVTFGVGFGVSGSVDKDTAFAATQNGTDINWPNTDSGSANCSGSACAARLDDLLHASINGRGDFFNAADSESFAEAMDDILSGIADRTSSAASVALNSGTIATDSRVYQARFDSGTWSGQLLAYSINNQGQLSNTPLWDAASLIPTANNRRVVTANPNGSGGRAFRWANLSQNQQTRVVSENVLNYIRGSGANELRNNGTFRNRNSRLGDIINSAPTFSGAPAQRYRDFWGTGAAENSSPYSNFRLANQNRQPLLFVGANDGMMHAFNATTGAEVFSYVPNAVLSNLQALTNPNYTHRYYVDNSPVVVDAFINNAWRTILVSGLGAGGQAIFALDVTNPGNFSNETNAAANVLWEFSDLQDNELGYTFGEPSIVRLQDGTWAAAFTGGYNNTVDNGGNGTANDSQSGNAFLYLVDLADGSVIKKFDTQRGMSQDPTGNNRPNGLAAPAVVDINGDQIADAIYAGDLFGNMWKIDLSGNGRNQWDFAYKQGNNPLPIFTACAGINCNGSNVQPITTRPVVVRHPTNAGYIVLFGTGKYFEVGDNNSFNQVTQSYYGIWDRAGNNRVSFNRSDMLAQQIIAEGNVTGNEYRVTSNNPINWSTHSGWYLDFLAPNSSNNRGERQVSQAVSRNGRIIFTTLIPSTDACDTGGDSWIMELSINTGARPEYSVFDLNNDGTFNTQDFYNLGDDNYVPVSGRKSNVGITSTPGFMGDGTGQTEYKLMSGADGNIESIAENPGPGFEGRQSWRQLEFLFRQ